MEEYLRTEDMKKHMLRIDVLMDGSSEMFACDGKYATNGQWLIDCRQCGHIDPITQALFDVPTPENPYLRGFEKMPDLEKTLPKEVPSSQLTPTYMTYIFPGTGVRTALFTSSDNRIVAIDYVYVDLVANTNMAIYQNPETLQIFGYIEGKHVVTLMPFKLSKENEVDLEMVVGRLARWYKEQTDGKNS